MTADGGVDAETLGRATWTFLHTLAASQPETLSTAEQQRLQRLMHDFSHVYPCAPCAEGFRRIIKKRPPVTKSGPLFAQWMCAAHNDVNHEIGKPQFDCSRVGERWGVCEECAAHKQELADFKATMKMFGQTSVKKKG